MEKTITVTNMFGKEKQLTKDQYWCQWWHHIGELVSICRSAEDWDALKEIRAASEAIVSREFERTHEEQKPTRYIYELAPLRLVPGDEEDTESCSHAEAELFGVYRRPEEGGTADHLEDFETAAEAAQRIAELYAAQG